MTFMRFFAVFFPVFVYMAPCANRSDISFSKVFSTFGLSHLIYVVLIKITNYFKFFSVFWKFEFVIHLIINIIVLH